MTDKEYIAQINQVSNEELIKKLEYCGHDGYYNDIYYAVIKELCQRLKVNYNKIIY